MRGMRPTQVVGRLAALLAWSCIAAGCADNRASFFIELIKVPTTECSIESTEQGLYKTSGYLDLAYRDNYVLTPLLKNDLAPRGSPEDFQAEVNGIQVEGANIRIWQGGRAQGDALYAFYQPAASYVAPQGVTASVFTAIPRQAVDTIVSARLGMTYSDATIEDLVPYSDLVTLGVRMLGKTNGNIDVETPEFYFPVRLCFSCQTACTPESRGDETTDAAYCTSTEALEETPCWPGQDDIVDCLLCVPLYGVETCQSWCSVTG